MKAVLFSIFKYFSKFWKKVKFMFYLKKGTFTRYLKMRSKKWKYSRSKLVFTKKQNLFIRKHFKKIFFIIFCHQVHQSGRERKKIKLKKKERKWLRAWSVFKPFPFQVISKANQIMTKLLKRWIETN